VTSSPQDLLAIEVGSSCVKLGWFPAQAACTSEKPAGNLPIAAPALPEPAELRRIQHRGREAAEWTAEINTAITELGHASQLRGVMASVHPGAAEMVRQMLDQASKFVIHTLKLHDIPLVMSLDEPQRVGIDRLLGAVAANRLRRPSRPAIVVDMGTAITVNYIAADGAFQGGAILPGPLTSLHALHKATASLPLLAAEAIDEPPPPVGKSTQQAMASGAYWGAVGAIQELILRMAKQGAAEPNIFLTGGASYAFAEVLRSNGQRLRHVPYLYLAGIKLVADEMARA
jgi:type III pantothenate kinase